MMHQDYKEMLSMLLDHKVEFLLIGAHACAAYSEPRATGDIDLWINSTEQNVDRVWATLTEFGAPLTMFDKKDFLTPEMVVQLGVKPVRIDFLTSLCDLDFSRAWERKNSFHVDGMDIPVIGKDDLIYAKKIAGRPQDLVDVSKLEASPTTDQT